MVLLRTRSHHKTQCRQLLITFLGQQLVVLHRSQIIFATLTLNVILAVIQWVQSTCTLSLLLSKSSAVTPEQDLHDGTRASVMSCTSSASSSVQELRLRPRRPYPGTSQLEQRYGFRLFPEDKQEGTRYSTSSPRNGHNQR